jgi:hypothetical protein
MRQGWGGLGGRSGSVCNGVAAESEFRAPGGRRKKGEGVELGVGVLVMLNPMSIRYPADLPITARREEIVAAIRGNWVLDLATETCSEGSQRDRHFIFAVEGTAFLRFG